MVTGPKALSEGRRDRIGISQPMGVGSSVERIRTPGETLFRQAGCNEARRVPRLVVTPQHGSPVAWRGPECQALMDFQ